MYIPNTISYLEQLISDKIEENINLDYKAADALQNTDNKKKEIAKDISAMANSAGGIIIYGIKEFDESDKKHLPEKIVPVKRSEFSKEWLEHVINGNVSPKIEGLLIHPVSLRQADEVVYVVEIPQSTTAHQNTKDHRYYKRYNFESVPMIDYEIRDIMNRTNHPVIELGFKIVKETFEVRDNFPIIGQYGYKGKQKEYRTRFKLKIYPLNTGSILAKYVNYFVQIPENVLESTELRHRRKLLSGKVEVYGENTHRDVVDVKTVGLDGVIHKYGPSRFAPVLPKLNGKSKELNLIENPELDAREITWTVHADNAPPNTGSNKLNEIPLIVINESDE